MSELHDKGLEVRREVLAREYVDRSLAATDEVTRATLAALTRVRVAHPPARGFKLAREVLEDHKGE